MKKLTVLACALFALGLSLNSCAPSRGCNGNWYNNRNVQVQPEINEITPTCYNVEAREDI